MSSKKIPIAIAKGDGIGPEIMDATLSILNASGVNLDYHEIEIGEKVYLKGCLTGIEPSTWETLRSTKAFLKAPITTPQGGGFKSLNVTIRTALGLYANVRPSISYHPYVKTKHPEMNVVIIRENEEDLYTGIEYRQTHQVYNSVKLISRPGTEKIIRFAFEYALKHKRKKVTCFTKDNIMKLADGEFHKIFDEISKEYPQIESEHWIIDIGAAKLADTPEAFDVIVLANLYGDILSDVAAQISGSVGLAGSANIGDYGSMFEAIHGSAPRRAGQNLANPSGLILASVLMLLHLEQIDAATKIHNAWLKTIEDGIHTYDIFDQKTSIEKVGTKEFANAVIKNLGKKPSQLCAVSYQNTQVIPHSKQTSYHKEKRELVGVDIYFYSNETSKEIIDLLTKFSSEHFSLKFISNRGAKIYPEGQKETFCVDQWRVRFLPSKEKKVSFREISVLAIDLDQLGLDIIRIENLYHFDGKPGFSN